MIVRRTLESSAPLVPSRRRGAWPGTPLAALGAALAAAVGPARAQVVEVTAVDPVTGRPLPYTITSLYDPVGRARAGGLTDSAGRARLRAPEPGRYVVRAERTGRRGVTSPILTLAATDTGRVRLALAEGVVLAPARVVSSRRCARLSPDDAAAAYTRWDEVRKALLSATAAVDGRAFDFALERTVRLFEPGGRRVYHAERVVDPTGDSLFVPAAAPPTLRDSGFVRRRWDDGPRPTVSYDVPDARVLVSDAFVDTHCFRPERADRARRGQLGLGFAPSRRGRDRRPDVRGTLWLDSASYELRELEFRYVDAPSDLTRGEAGGRTRFARRDDGLWYVADWQVRMPVLGEARTVAGVIAPPLLAMREEGGRTLLGADVPRAHPDSVVVAGVVVDSTRELRAVVGASVALAGSAHTAATDSSGRFRLALPFGAVAADSGGRTVNTLLVLRHHRLASLGVGTVRTAVGLARGRESQVSLAFPASTTVQRLACGDEPAVGAVIVGAVRRYTDAQGYMARDSATAPVVAGATVVVQTTAGPAFPVGTRGTAINVAAGPGGVYALCNVPGGSTVRLSARHAGLEGGDAIVDATAGGLFVQDLWVDPVRPVRRGVRQVPNGFDGPAPDRP